MFRRSLLLVAYFGILTWHINHACLPRVCSRDDIRCGRYTGHDTCENELINGSLVCANCLTHDKNCSHFMKCTDDIRLTVAEYTDDWENTLHLADDVEICIVAAEDDKPDAKLLYGCTTMDIFNDHSGVNPHFCAYCSTSECNSKADLSAPGMIPCPPS